jgi:beta-galactosidase
MIQTRTFPFAFLVFSMSFIFISAECQEKDRELFDTDWKFKLDSVHQYARPVLDDRSWRKLTLPHDWSIEGKFDRNNPAGTWGGALPGGIGWYRKSFLLPTGDKGKRIFIDFDGVYRNSEVWINGHSLGVRPNGYISFRYDLTDYLLYGNQQNVLVVKVDNSRQPNSRWYSGSGIYRNVWLVKRGKVFIDHWGTYLNTLVLPDKGALIDIRLKIRNELTTGKKLRLRTILYDAGGISAGSVTSEWEANAAGLTEIRQTIRIASPHLWSTEDPYLYKAVSEILDGDLIEDRYSTPAGIRTFDFDSQEGFSLNGHSMKINGVCDHHDLGCLGAAVSRRALERQLEILKAMGCNAIRTSHNPPAPELLDLCDSMGFIVMDEAFDMWKKPKSPYDYHLYWDQWHARDLQDQVLRDRNHPSVMIWSIGNEIPEQWAGPSGADSSGRVIARELAGIIRVLDTTRPVTSACDHPGGNNSIIASGALDLVGYNYHQQMYPQFLQTYPGKKFLGTETVSALQTRGHYDMPSDSIRRWPERWDKPFDKGNPDLTCSAYDNVSAPWGSTHEETWKLIKKYNFLSGQFIWTGFDYMGEPTPYPWPARSSYFGIIDIAGFPKDIYYMYQSEWTNKPVLHIFPHWNWKKGDSVDIWAYYSQAEEVELFVNGISAGIRRKSGDDLHVFWRVAFSPGSLRAVSRAGGRPVLTTEIKTAGKAARIHLSVDRNHLQADGRDLGFVKATITDAADVPVPDAEISLKFTVEGAGRLVATDNGSETSLESFQSDTKKTFNGLCLAVVRSALRPGPIIFRVSGEGLQGAGINLFSGK